MNTAGFKIAGIILVCSTISLAADKPPRYTILTVKATPKIDGRLDEVS